MSIVEKRRKNGRNRYWGQIGFLTALIGVAGGSAEAQTAIDRLGGSILQADQQVWRWERDMPVRVPQNEAEGASWDPMIEQQRVVSQLERGSYELGAIDAQLLIDHYPHDIDQVDIALQQGLALIRRGELGKARTEFNRAYEIANGDERYEDGPEMGTALYYIALTGLADGYQPTEKTSAMLEEFLRRYPGHPKEPAVLHLLGEIALRRQLGTGRQQPEPDRRAQALDRLLEGRDGLDRLEDRRDGRGRRMHRREL